MLGWVEFKTSETQSARWRMPPECSALHLFGRTSEPLEHTASQGVPVVYSAGALLLDGWSLEPLEFITWLVGYTPEPWTWSIVL